MTVVTIEKKKTVEDDTELEECLELSVREYYTPTGSLVLENRRNDCYEAAMLKIGDIQSTLEACNLNEGCEDIDKAISIIKKVTIANKFNGSRFNMPAITRDNKGLNIKEEDKASFVNSILGQLEYSLDAILRHKLFEIQKDLEATINYNRKIELEVNRENYLKREDSKTIENLDNVIKRAKKKLKEGV